MRTVEDILQLLVEEAVAYVDLRFTDPRGRLHHLTLAAERVDAEAFANGLMFDGSSIAGWKSVDQSDMKLMPDPATAYLDPFHAERTLCLHCTITAPDTAEPYGRDPRSTAIKAVAFLRASGIGDTAHFGPEAEFYLFDDVRYSIAPRKIGYAVDAVGAAWNTDTRYEIGNHAHRAGHKGGYLSINPVDDAHDLRSEMLSTMKRLGLRVDKHHHARGTCQHELGLIHGPLVEQADAIQIYKYVIHNVAAAYGKTATFMPKPIKGDNGSGMNVNISIWKGGRPLFAGDRHAGLSQEALWFIGGILKHAPALNALTNPTTNSYKRLVPGLKAPVLRAYSARNRSGCIRIPWVENPAATRIEARFPDPSANPYLAFAALLMAGLDGIRQQIDPGLAIDKGLDDLPPAERVDVPTVATSLREALTALAQDMDFLLAGDVFTRDQLESYMALKWAEVEAYEQTPHPIEYQLYYSC